MTAASDESDCRAVRVFTLGGRIYPGRLLRNVDPAPREEASVCIGSSVYSPADSIAGDPIIGVVPTDYKQDELVDLFNEAVPLRHG
jgi:hypothetical protein